MSLRGLPWEGSRSEKADCPSALLPHRCRTAARASGDRGQVLSTAARRWEAESFRALPLGDVGNPHASPGNGLAKRAVSGPVVWNQQLASDGEPETQMLVAATADSTGVPGSRLISLRRTGREIPSFFILAIKVVRFSPSRSAAPPNPPITQPASRNACKISARVESLNVPCEGVTVSGFLSDAGRGLVTAFLSDVGSGFGSTPLFDRMTARSIKF